MFKSTIFSTDLTGSDELFVARWLMSKVSCTVGEYDDFTCKIGGRRKQHCGGYGKGNAEMSKRILKPVRFQQTGLDELIESKF